MASLCIYKIAVILQIFTKSSGMGTLEDRSVYPMGIATLQYDIHGIKAKDLDYGIKP